MDYQEYKDLYDSLSEPEDVFGLISEGYDEELIKTLYTQKINRYVKKKFHYVKSKSPLMLKLWKEGLTMMEISEKFKFPPVLIAMMIFRQDGVSKKKFWNCVNNPEQLTDEVANELEEVIYNDLVYSPAANKEQRQRGEWGETRLHQWLDNRKIAYYTESDLRGTYEKTPDVLFKYPMSYNGEDVFWVESKASFGDSTEFKYNCKEQLIPYTKIFGPGVVIYWMGYLDNLKCPENIYVADSSILK